MFGFVKTWLRRPAEGRAIAHPVSQMQFHAHHPSRQSVAAIVEPHHGNGGNGTGEVPGKILELPLSAIFKGLPADLQAGVRLPADGDVHVAVPLSAIFPQLGRGSVRITFGELREMSPPGLFHAQTDRDQAVVELPLAEILARLHPSLLPRRAQKSLEVPDAVTSPFAAKGQGLHIYKPDPAPTHSFIRKIDDSPVVPVFPARGSINSVPPGFPSTMPPAPAARPDLLSMRPSAPPHSIGALVQAAAHPSNDGGTVLSVTLAELSPAWPRAVQEEIQQMNLSGARVALPLSFIEDGLKKGRTVSAWKQVREWMNAPAAALVASPHDSELLELPLQVIAPLFLARQRFVKNQHKAALDASIPDLFSGPARPGTTPPAVNGGVKNGTFKPASTGDTTLFDRVEETGKARQSANIRSGTEFLKRYATPSEIVAKAAALGGVAGALVTLPDGLLVASQLPVNANGDSLAAFLPQIYARAAQSVRELNMGELRNVKFTAGSTAWEIYRVGSIFFAAFARPEEALPTAQIAALAAELDRKPKETF